MKLMSKEERDRIEEALDPNRRFKMPPEMTDEMRHDAYRSYCNSLSKKGYVAWDDICECFCAAFDAGREERK